mgnify:CR=1 FL=1
MFDNIMVLHFIDGKILKGWGSLISPYDKTMEFQDLSGNIHIVDLSLLKGAFYVKTFEGSPKKGKAVEPTWLPQGDRIKVIFKDNEELEGISQLPEDFEKVQGFYVVPCDAASNNYRIYINIKAVSKILKFIKSNFFIPIYHS